MGWVAFFVTLIILLVYRANEGKRDDARKMAVSFAKTRITELEEEVAALKKRLKEES